MVHVEKSNSLGKNNMLKKDAIKTESLSLNSQPKNRASLSLSLSLSLKVDNVKGGTTRGSRPHDGSHPCLLPFSLCC